MRIVLEAGGSSPWVSRFLEELGHEVIVCSPRRIRLIAESTLKNDKVDAEVLARLLRMDPAFLKPVHHRSEKTQLMRSKLLVRRGQKVTRGQVIGQIGSTGLATAPHLHYEVRVTGKAANPLNYVIRGAVP